MSDAQWKARVSRIKDPKKMLAEVRFFAAEYAFGDSYYRDLEDHLWAQVDRVLEERK